MIAQSVPLLTKGHTYAMCIYTVGRRPLLSSSDSHLKFARFRKVRRKRRERLQFKIGQTMDFYLASDSSPAIHSKTTAKVIKRIGFTKFWVFFLAYLIYISYLCHQINNNNIIKEVIMEATKNNTKEETIRKFKQLLKHKEEMLERAKQYDGIDIYAKT